MVAGGGGAGASAVLHLPTPLGPETKVDCSTSFSREGCCSSTGSRRLIREAGHRGGAGHRFTGVLLPPLCGTQARREVAASDRPEHAQRLRHSAALQDGDSQVGAQLSQGQRVCHLLGPVGCISTRAHSGFFAPVSEICHRRRRLRLHRNAFRLKPFSMGVYTNYGVGDDLRQTHVLDRRKQLPGRYTTEESRRARVSSTLTSVNQCARVLRVEDKLREIRLNSISRVCPPGHVLSDTAQSRVPYEQATTEDLRSRLRSSPSPGHNSACASKLRRYGTGSGRAYPYGASHTSSSTMGLARSTVACPVRLGHSSTHLRRGAHSHNPMAERRLASARGGAAVSSSLHHPVHRRVSSGLGSSSTAGVSRSSRSVDSSGAVSTHQRVGDAGCGEGANSLAPGSPRLSRPGHDRQHHCVRVPKKPRWSALQDPVSNSSEAVTYVPRQRSTALGQAHSGEAERHRRQPLQETASLYRVDASCRGVSTDLATLPRAPDRSVCYQAHGSPPSVRLSVSRQPGFGRRRADADLDGKGPLRFSADSPDSSLPTEVRVRAVSGSTGGPSAVAPNVDHSSTAAFGGASTSTPTSTGPFGSTSLRQPLSEPPSSESASLEAIRRSLEGRGFQPSSIVRILRDKRPSTLEVYTSKWEIYADWCKSIDHDPLAACPAIIADFFVYLFEEKRLQPITIRGYAAAITRLYELCDRISPCKDRTIQSLFANFEYERPKCHTLVPKWSLDIVLDYLVTDKFKDTPARSLQDLTWKTVFLVAMATAYRVSELHALSRDSTSLRWNQDGSVSLATRDGFIAKNKRPTAAGQRTTIRPLTEQPDLCPVGHLRSYLVATGEQEGADHLFRSLKDPSARMTPQTISGWISTTIREAYHWKARQDLSVSTGAPLLLMFLPLSCAGELLRGEESWESRTSVVLSHFATTWVFGVI